MMKRLLGSECLELVDTEDHSGKAAYSATVDKTHQEEENMRKTALGMIALLCIGVSGLAETMITAQDYAVDSDVVLESALKEVKSAPSDTINVIGDTIKYVADETVTATKGAIAVFKSDPVEKAERDALAEIASAWDSSNDVLFRSYKVTPAVGEELTAGAISGKGGALDISGSFSGIDFPAKTSVYYRPEFNRVFIRQTLENILAIEDVLAEMHSAERDLMGKQVEIETKFVEINQSTLNELGFDWRLDSSQNLIDEVLVPGQSIFSAGLRSAADSIAPGSSAAVELLQRTGQNDLNWRMFIRAMEQENDTDVLSAPSIVTRDGTTASIMVGEKRTVSTGFDVKSLESSLFIEHDLDDQLMGVSLEVTPELRSDNLIDLKLKPKVIDLIGYDTYQAHPAANMLAYSGEDAAGMEIQGTFPIQQYTDSTATTITEAWQWMFDSIGSDPNTTVPSGDSTDEYYHSTRRKVTHDERGIPLAALNARLPYYRLREIETQVTVADGSTVGMGGLIYDKLETFKDKVPVLGSIPFIGRLFRSEGEKSVKRNLLVFVTATQVDVNGRKASDLALKQ
jgi:general secretion pathway protein D